jgi:hypothetical protein
MRDPVLEESLKRLAAEAATRFSSLVATGDQIPFDVAENEGETGHFYRYVPLTDSYIESHLEEIRSLPAFGPAKGAVVASGVAAGYLGSRGESVPSDPGLRAETMIIHFISALWEGSGDFSLDLGRVERALDMLEVESRDIREANVMLVPLVGFETTLSEVEFGNGIRVIRSDAMELPAEVAISGGTDRNAWQPSFIATAALNGEADGPRAAMHSFTQLVDALRLAGEGCVGLGPHAFAPVGDDSWRRLETGASPGRQGTYFLVERDIEKVDEILRSLDGAASEAAVSGFACRRFLLGCERERPLDAVSDHLLALRSMFAGESLANALLAARVAAVIPGCEEGLDARERLEAAFELEEALMADREVTTVRGESVSYLAAWLEDSTRHVIGGAILGAFGADLNATAEEVLITEGLSAADGEGDQMGSTAEWDAIDPSSPEIPSEVATADHAAEVHVLRPDEHGQPRPIEPEVALPDPAGELAIDAVPEFEKLGNRREDAERGSEEFPETAREDGPVKPQEIHLERMPEIERALGIDIPFGDGDDHDLDEVERPFADIQDSVPELIEPTPEPGEITVTASGRDWLDEETSPPTMEWPTVTGRSGIDPDERIGQRSPGNPFAGLYPKPEEADWPVAELEYRRRPA